MAERRRAPVLAVAALALALAGCAKAPAEDEGDGPDAVHVQRVAGTERPRITLTQSAVDRLDVRLEPVSADGNGTAIPYAAVLYDPAGATWTFVSSRPRVFSREPITVARIDGDKAFLTAGPPVGTRVVTVGGAELYGAELGVGDDE